MSIRVYILSVMMILSISGCKTEIKEDRVKKEAQRSLEIALDYINQERALHEFDLNRKIRLVNEKIKKSGDPQSNATLKAEKLDLELKLKVLIANTDASTKRISEKWSRYNQSLDAMLKNMQDYLKGIPIDRDTLSKKDSLR
jgi:hypothetical protein